MCERYFIEFPPPEPLSLESLLEESLALVHPKDISIHDEVFLMPFERNQEKPEKKRIWSRSNQIKVDSNPGTILRDNIKFMIRKTKHFGLLLSQLTWVGIMNFAEKRRVLQQNDDDLRTAALYIIMLKKEAAGLTQFINCLHMTGNHEIANIIEEKLELLVEEYENEYQLAGYEASLEDWHGHYLPYKKRKTSADSGFDDTDDERALGGTSSGQRRRYKCRIKPLDAVDVIAIINGKEDSRCKVELCKCGHYHQFPKWKDLSGDPHSKENNSMMTMTPSRFTMYFSMKRNEKKAAAQQPKQGILSPVTQPVELGMDLSHGESDELEFTKPRRSCSHLRLRFSNTNSFAEHPDSVQELASGNGSESVGKKNSYLKSRLPSFLRRFL